MAYALRKPTPSDLDHVIRIHCDPRTNRFRPGGPPSSDEAAEYLPRWLSHWDQHGFGYWTVVQGIESGKVLGFGGVIAKRFGQQDALNLYFRLDPASWGQGVAHFIGQRALELAFLQLGDRWVIGKVRPENQPSRRALERLGLEPCGQEEDVPGAAASLLYGISPQAYATRSGLKLET